MLSPEHTHSQSQRILVFLTGEAPPVVREALQAIDWMRCGSTAEIERELATGAGLVLLIDQLSGEQASKLSKALQHQPAWSGTAVVTLGKPGASEFSTASGEGRKTNHIALDETVSASSLGSILSGLLRERVRQYDRGAHSAESAEIAILKETIRSLDGFCHTVAHDLRAPLRAMQGLSTALLEDYGDVLSGDGLDYARRIITAAARMDRLIQDLLAYNRLDRLEIVPVDLNLDVLVDSILVAQASDIKAARAEVRVDRPLPPLRSSQAIVEQAISHLVSNAVKFVRPNTIPRVRIWAEQHADRVRFWVEDNGIGIDPRHHERIYNVFERLHGEESFPGTGIGLALVRKGAQRLRGQSGLQSELGKGSSFWVEFPQIERHTQSGSG